MWSPFKFVEDVFMRGFARGSTLDAERAHHEAVKNMQQPGSRWPAYDYLYSRLNIVDAKASSILTVNTISLGVASVVLASGSGPNAFVQEQPQAVFVAGATAICLSILAIFLTLAITRLQFDHMSPGHSESEYRQAFFEITVARQKILALARLFTAIAFLLYAVLLVWGLLRARGW